MQELAETIESVRTLSERLKGFFGLERHPEWPKLNTGGYFERLQKRLVAVEAWARSTQPRLSFVGDWHRGPGQAYTTRDASVVHRRRHEWLYGAIKEHLTEPLLVAIEEDGRDGLLDQAKYIALAREGRVRAGLPPMSHKQMVECVEHQKHEVWAYMKTKKDVRFICGEEWPHRLHYSILHAWDVKSQQGELATSTNIEEGQFLITALRVLRSEIIVIRTLEWMERIGRQHGVIEQGNKHLPDIEARAKALGIEFQGKVMPAMELEII